jgi:hypothetical protein
MPANYDEYFQAFTDLVGTADEQSVYSGAEHSAGSVDDWIDIFESTGIDFESHAHTVDAFENFLIAFYPQEGVSGDDWFYTREEFYEMYGISDNSIDWEAYREAIGY